MDNSDATIINVVAASRPHPTEYVNGDGWIVDWWGERCRIAIIDGLGHGPEAARATTLARTALAEHPRLDPARAMQVCHKALHGTRGAAIALAQVDLAAGRLVYAAIGNTEARLVRSASIERLIAYRGIVGRSLRTVRTFQVELSDTTDWMLVLHTDGVSERFELDSFLSFQNRDAQQLATDILQSAGRVTDDATVVVAVPTPG